MKKVEGMLISTYILYQQSYMRWFKQNTIIVVVVVVVIVVVVVVAVVVVVY